MSAELVKLFDDDQRRRNLQPTTRILRRRQLELFERESGLIEDATTEQISAWLDTRKRRDGEPIGAKTRSCYLTSFSSFFTWAIEAEYLDRSPIKKTMRPKVHNGTPNPMPEKSLAWLLDHATPLLRCWIALEAYAGLRCQEVAFLEHSDIDRVEGRILIRRGKGGKQRYVPDIHPKIIEALDAFDGPTEGRLWPFITPASVSQRLNRYFHANGVVHTAHKLRHRFGTVAYQASGQSLLTTQRLLGHSNPATTAIYAAVSDEEGRAAIRGIA